MESFAEYILNEVDFSKKVEIILYLKKKREISFDTSVIFKSTVAKMFMDTVNMDVDKNLVLTASLLCGCKKVNHAQDFEKIKKYAVEGAEFLADLGFSKKFCKICEEHNRYSGSSPREKESDILELADQFGGMMLDRPERRGFPIDEALTLLEYRNLKNIDNIYMEDFKNFIEAVREVNA